MALLTQGSSGCNLGVFQNTTDTVYYRKLHLTHKNAFISKRLLAVENISHHNVIMITWLVIVICFKLAHYNVYHQSLKIQMWSIWKSPLNRLYNKLHEWTVLKCISIRSQTARRITFVLKVNGIIQLASYSFRQLFWGMHDTGLHFSLQRIKYFKMHFFVFVIFFLTQL